VPHRITVVDDTLVAELATLLVDVVEGGASVGFLLPLTQADAETWWRDALVDPHTRTWVVRDGDGVAGCVRLTRASKANSAHRGEITKLMVARRARRAGLATRLMDVAESTAWDELSLRLLLLDTQTDSPAQPFYLARGWRVVAVIDDYAATPSGEPSATTMMELRRPG
jgi:GNAT superfamily N-acetyltransferase